MFCTSSCLLEEKAPLLRDLHPNVCRQCIRPDKFTYTLSGRGNATVQLIDSELAGTQLPHRLLMTLSGGRGRETGERECGKKKKKREEQCCFGVVFFLKLRRCGVQTI